MHTLCTRHSHLAVWTGAGRGKPFKTTAWKMIFNDEKRLDIRQNLKICLGSALSQNI